jgi:hypothetical protein
MKTFREGAFAIALLIGFTFGSLYVISAAWRLAGVKHDPHWSALAKMRVQ